MSVFKRKYTSLSGKSATIQKYSVDFRDHTGVLRRVAAFTDRSASLELERQLKKLVALRMTGAGLDAELSRFLETCPAAIRERLGEWGIIDPARAAAGKRLADHAEEWRGALTAKGNSKEYVTETIAKIKRLSNACGWRQLSDISATGFDRWRTDARNGGTSAETTNMYLTALRNFCNWLVKEKRLSENPVAHIAKLNGAMDRRRERRAFTVEELGKILTAAESGGTVHCMTGADRVLLYRFAVETGFRWSECQSLTRASFDFEAEPATVTIRAEDAKNRKEDTLPLRAPLASALKERMALFAPTAKAFPGMWRDKGAVMLRVDLEAAGVPYVDEYGRIGDFHAFRHTYGTLGAKAGIPLATMQRLMRHSDPKLTANLYTHVLVQDKAEELSKLPQIAAIDSAKQHVATGTCAISPESGQKVVMPIGSSGTDFEAKITTYSDGKKGGKHPVFALPENEKSPVPQGSTGDECDGGRYWTRTSDPYNVSVVLYQLS